MPIVQRQFMPDVPAFLQDEREHRRQLAQAINQIKRDEGLPPRWEPVIIPASSMMLGAGGADPSKADLPIGALSVWYFSNTASNELHFQHRLPHGYAETTNIRPFICWFPDVSVTGIATDTVEWVIQFALVNPGDAISNASTVRITATAESVARYRTSTLSVISASSVQIGAALLGKIVRNGANPGDTYSAPAGLICVGFNIERDSRGSQDEFTKWITG